MVGLLGRAALAVDRRGGRRVGQALAQPRVAGDVRALLAGLRDAAADDLVDLGRVDAGPLDQLGLHGAEDLGRVQPRQPPVAAPDGGPHCFDDDGFRVRCQRRFGPG